MLDQLIAFGNGLFYIYGLILACLLFWFTAKSSTKAEEESPRYRVARSGSFEEKLRRARMEASQPIEVPITQMGSNLADNEPKKQLSWSVDTDEDNRPDFSFDSGNASGSDSENVRKSLSDSGDDGTSSDEERNLKELLRKDSDELLFPGSQSRITKVTAVSSFVVKSKYKFIKNKFAR